jgi:transcriptional regulator with XRE-family HTH domain
MSADKIAIGARLRAERKARGWDKPEMARRLAEVLAGPRVDHESLVSYVKRWEPGKVAVSERYRLAYARAFGVDEEQLFRPAESALWRPPDVAETLNGTFTPDHEERLQLALEKPARVDSTAAESLSTILAAQRRTEDVIGSGAMIPAARSHLELILRLLKEARGPIAERLAAIAADASQFVGWLYAATGAHETASPLYDQSLRLGLQASDNDLAATALSMRGHLAWVTGDITAMAGLSQAAEELATSTGTRTVAIQQGGRALALLGDRQGALRAVGRAEEVLTRPSSRDDPDLLYFYGPELLTMQRGLILAYLAGSATEYAAAADLIAAAIEALPPAVRDSEWVAWYRVQAARARAAAGAPEESAAGLRVALDIVSATGGARTRAEIAEVHQSMAEKWPDDPDVAELGEALR